MNFILLTFLLFVALTSSYSISKVKQRHLRETHVQGDSSAIYKVEDDGKTVKFSFPKQDKPTLREIVYYHVIEEPYPGESFHGSVEVSEESKSQSSSEEDDDLVVTERPFTNGHGYQFLFNDTDTNDSSADSSFSDEADNVTTEIVYTDYDDDFIEPELDEEEKKEFEKLLAELYKDEESNETTLELENKQLTSTIPTVLGLTTPKSPSKKDDTNKDIIEEEKLNVPSANKTSSTTEEQEIRNTELISKVNVTDSSVIAEEKITELEDKGEEVSSSETAEVADIDMPQANLNKDDVVEEKKSARASLFNQAREKYQSKMRKKQQRRKRDVKSTYMPEAPKLSPLNLDSLPEYVRKLISTPAPEITTAKVQLKSSTNFDEEALQKELEDRIEGIMATLKPKLLEDSDSESYEDEGSSIQDEDDENESENSRDKVENANNRQARTYGMNMTMGRGYVWNDLLGDPGMYIEVGEPDEKNKITENIEPTEAPMELPSSTHYLTESKPIYMNSLNIEENSDKDQKGEDSNDIFVEVKTNKPVHIMEHKTEKDLIANHIVEHTTEKISIGHSTETTTAKNEHLETENIKEDENNKESNIEKPTTEKIDISTEKPKQEDVKDGENESSTAVNKNEQSVTEAATKNTTKLNNDDMTSTKNKTEEKVNTTTEQTTKNNENNTKLGDLETKKEEAMDETIKRKIIEITKSEILQELFKNDEFWKWLGSWTTKYTELLMKHVKNMVHDEVGRQMKKLTSHFKKQIQNEIEEALKSKEKPVMDDKEKSNESDKPKTQDENAHLQEENSAVENIKEINDTVNNGNENKEKPADLHKEDSKISEKDTEITISDDKILIDGKEIPITHNTNFNSENLLKRKQDKDRENKHPSPNTDHLAVEIKDETKDKTNVTSKRDINVTAQNIYGNSAGSEKVTNVFIFYPHDDEEISDFKPFGNGNQDNDILIDKRRDEAQDLVGQKDVSTSTTDVPKEKLTTEKPRQDASTTVAPQEKSTTEKPREEITETSTAPQEESTTEKPKDEISTTTVVPQDISITTEKPKEEITTTTVIPQKETTTEKPKESKEEITSTTVASQEISSTEKPKDESKEQITSTTAVPQEVTTEKSSEVITTSDILKEPSSTEKPKEESKEEIATTTAVSQEVTTEKPSEATTSDILKDTSSTEKPKDDNKEETTEAPIENKTDDVTEKPHSEGLKNHTKASTEQKTTTTAVLLEN